MSNYSKSKSEALRIFKDQCNNFPLWTLFELGKRNAIYSNNDQGDESKTIKLFEGALADLYPDKMYTVKMFRDLRHRKGGQKFIQPNHEFSFLFTREEAAPVIIGTQQPQAQHQQPSNPYGVDMSQRINLNDHVQLIAAKAKAEADCAYFQNMYNDKVKECTELERELQELEVEFDKLEAEMEEMEKEAEAEELAKVSGDKEKETSIEGAIASVIKEHGGVLVEHLAGKVKEETTGLDGAEELKDEKVISGVGLQLMEMPLTQLHEKMLEIDPKWKQHLCKLILIGQQKPLTFKMLIAKLEAF